MSGLGRVLPLTYAGGTLTGARQDMARIRGISEADRAHLAGRVAAVLGRDPAVVRHLKLDPAHVRRSRSQPPPSRYPAGMGGLRPAKRRTGRPPFRLETQAQDVWPW